MSNDRGYLVVVTAPSGAGKSTLVHNALQRLPNLTYSVSYTTRALRGQERDGCDYFFVTVEQFLKMRESGHFIECAEVHGHWYGTARHVIEEQLDNGRDVILDIDVQGAAQIRNLMPHAITIFILPPSFAVLEQRLRDRNTDNRYDVETRLSNARKEVERYTEFDYLIINEDREVATQALISVITAARYRRECQETAALRIIKTFHEDLGGETFHA
ncbi:MAG TPA: guanylate kinase [Blastocatellia bacterium]|nr:guanylate kinase [Blastocatellia bacterium]